MNGKKKDLTETERAWRRVRDAAERAEKERNGTLKSPSATRKRRKHGRPR